MARIVEMRSELARLTPEASLGVLYHRISALLASLTNID
jgi:hypothetical protein